MSMKLEARISTIVGEPTLKAYASICIDDAILIKGLKVINGKHGRFVAMPSKKDNRGEFRDVCFPITTEARRAVEEAILEAYSKKLEVM